MIKKIIFLVCCALVGFIVGVFCWYLFPVFMILAYYVGDYLEKKWDKPNTSSNKEIN
jgi:TRAP-type mannitol/chloroaromatic compound transport system permease small subunit